MHNVWKHTFSKTDTLESLATFWHFAAFSNILLETFVPNLASLTRPSLQILTKIQTGISDFPISGQSLIKEICHNSRTSDDVYMKLGLVPKLDKRNKATSKKIDGDVVSASCDVIVIFLIYGKFGAIGKSISGCIVCKTYIFIKKAFYLTKTENRTKKSLTQLSHYCFE